MDDGRWRAPRCDVAGGLPHPRHGQPHRPGKLDAHHWSRNDHPPEQRHGHHEQRQTVHQRHTGTTRGFHADGKDPAVGRVYQQECRPGNLRWHRRHLHRQRRGGELVRLRWQSWQPSQRTRIVLPGRRPERDAHRRSSDDARRPARPQPQRLDGDDLQPYALPHATHDHRRRVHRRTLHGERQRVHRMPG